MAADSDGAQFSVFHQCMDKEWDAKGRDSAREFANQGFAVCAMAESVSSKNIRKIFMGAAGQEGDAVMLKPGTAGLVMLLQPHFPEYDITAEGIGDTLTALSWAEDCSFTFEDFESFLEKYLATVASELSFLADVATLCDAV